MLEVRDLSKSFGGIQAVQRCNFSVQEGSVTGLIGPNGSGKTTCFNLITGFLKPDTGEVRFKGNPITARRPSQICHEGISRTFQITRLFKNLTALENMIVPVRQVGFRTLFHDSVKRHEEERAMELLSFVGLTELKDELAGNLSFGQQKLLEFAAILMAEPELVLLDEPAGGVNPVMIEKIEGHIRELNERGITFLVVEHNMRMVMGLCDYVIVLHHGTNVAEGEPEEIQNDPRVLEAYLGD
ncbi:MAG: ABC transporter ATP-binding protein [Anaerolineae bacterium]